MLSIAAMNPIDPAGKIHGKGLLAVDGHCDEPNFVLAPPDCKDGIWALFFSHLRGTYVIVGKEALMPWCQTQYQRDNNYPSWPLHDAFCFRVSRRRHFGNPSKPQAHILTLVLRGLFLVRLQSSVKNVNIGM